MFLKTALEDISVHIEKEGNEEPESRDKKVNMMKRAVAILHNVLEDRYIEMAEEELGKLPDMDIFGEITEQEHAVFERARELENSEWKELWQIIEGNENDVFDGSGLRGWWD